MMDAFLCINCFSNFFDGAGRAGAVNSAKGVPNRLMRLLRPRITTAPPARNGRYSCPLQRFHLCAIVGVDVGLSPILVKEADRYEINVTIEQLNSTQLNSTQLNSTQL